MSQLTDQTYLLTDQYRDASNLNARIQLHARFSTNARGWWPWVFDQLDLPPACHTLELGCGPGDLWWQNDGRIPPGWRITLSDFSPGMLDQAWRNLGHIRERFHFALIDAQAIPFGDARFDAVIANHMLYHVPDRNKALEEMQRVLRPGGHLYATTIGQNHMRDLDELMARFSPEMAPPAGHPPTSFLLENGAQELDPWFAEVTRHRYIDDLVITEAAPLIAYVLSTSDKGALAGERLARFTRFVEQDLAAHGAIRIGKDSGLFVARRGS